MKRRSDHFRAGPGRLQHPMAKGRKAVPAPATPPGSPVVLSTSPAGTPAPATPPAGTPAPAAPPRTPASERPPQLDGTGRPYITLAQFLKREQFADTGGGSKHLARSGAAMVNGEAEARPGRKLHDGDQVALAGRTLTVQVAPTSHPPGAPPPG